MNYLIVSDSHGLILELEELKNTYPDYQILHAGDFTINEKILNDLGIIYVKGNCDTNGPLEKVLNTNECLVYMVHGDIYNVKFGLDRLFYRALELGAKFVVFGHTHRPFMEQIEGITFLNPGSLRDLGSFILLEDGQYKLHYLKEEK